MDDDIEPSAMSEIARKIGKTPAEVAAVDRCFAGIREVNVARLMFDLACMDTAGKMRDLNVKLTAMFDEMNAEAARECAEHPDLAYLNAQMDGFFGWAIPTP